MARPTATAGGGEAEDRAEQLRAVARVLEGAVDQVDAPDEVLQVGVLHDDPPVPVAIVLTPNGGSRLIATELQQFTELVPGPSEGGTRRRLVGDGRLAGRAQARRHLEGDSR